MYPDKLHDECGVFGVFGDKEAARLTYLGLHALQHRGQESAGIVSSDGKNVNIKKRIGLISEVFTEDDVADLKGHLAIGHVRYSTTGSSRLINAQPVLVRCVHGAIAVAHNGNFTNSISLHRYLTERGAIFRTTIDSEIVVQMIAQLYKIPLPEAIIKTFSKIRGAYSIVLMNEDTLYAIRDPHGFRPLCLGKLNGAYVVASETCALDLIKATYLRDIEPGEILMINKKGLKSLKPYPKVAPAHCIFEFVYFARPDSLVFERSVHHTRQAMGRRLALESPAAADLVIAVPDSGNCAALGYAQESFIPFEIGITRNHYIGRTFIEPHQKLRDFKVKIKLNPIREVLNGKRIVLIDDSIVRGTTSRMRIQAVRDAGAREIHLRISSPPVSWPCYYGIDTPQRKQLIAGKSGSQKKIIKDIEKFLGADTLAYLSLEGMLASTGLPAGNFCTACFSGKYPVAMDKHLNKYSLETCGEG
jgi:amidophosphoribosyltransferase